MVGGRRATTAAGPPTVAQDRGRRLQVIRVGVASCLVLGIPSRMRISRNRYPFQKYLKEFVEFELIFGDDIKSVVYHLL